MNMGAYNSQDPQTLGSRVEELVRSELGLSSAVPFQIIGAQDAKGFTAGSLLSDVATGVFGGKTTLLMSVGFELTQPRVVALQVQLDRQGIGAHLGTLLYSTRLNKPVRGDVTLEDPKTFGTSKFVSPQDPGAAERLSANKDLLKRVNKFARTECPNFHLKGPRLFQIKPEGDAGSNLVAATFPRSYAMGFKISLDLKEFVDLAGMVEAAL
jgi:hypothetical protein